MCMRDHCLQTKRMTERQTTDQAHNSEGPRSANQAYDYKDPPSIYQAQAQSLKDWLNTNPFSTDCKNTAHCFELT